MLLNIKINPNVAVIYCDKTLPHMHLQTFLEIAARNTSAAFILILIVSNVLFVCTYYFWVTVYKVFWSPVVM